MTRVFHTWLRQLAARLKSERGESLAETLAGILIATFSIVVLMSATVSATNINHRAEQRNAQIQAQQEYAASFGNSSAQDGVTVTAEDALDVTFKGAASTPQTFTASYYGGDDFISYIQTSGVTATGSWSIYDARTGKPKEGATVTQSERARISADLLESNPYGNVWAEESNNGKKYYALRVAADMTGHNVALVYYKDAYYKLVDVTGADTPGETTADAMASFAPNALDTVLLDSGALIGGDSSGQRWVKADA